MFKSDLLKMRQMETDLQEIECLISHLHHTELKYGYLQKVAALRKEMVESLLLHYDMRNPTTPFTLADLKQNYNGKNNQPAYVAIDGIVYDITYVGAWAGGTHFGIQAGEDVSNALANCHGLNKDKIISQLTPVGVLES